MAAKVKTYKCALCLKDVLATEAVPYKRRHAHANCVDALLIHEEKENKKSKEEVNLPLPSPTPSPSPSSVNSTEGEEVEDRKTEDRKTKDRKTAKSRILAKEASKMSEEEFRAKRKIVEWIEEITGERCDVASHALLKRYAENYGFTFEGVYNALMYWYVLKGNSIRKETSPLAIIPYVYEKAEDYYDSLKDINNTAEIKNRTVKINVDNVREYGVSREISLDGFEGEVTVKPEEVIYKTVRNENGELCRVRMKKVVKKKRIGGWNGS